MIKIGNWPLISQKSQTFYVGDKTEITLSSTLTHGLASKKGAIPILKLHCSLLVKQIQRIHRMQAKFLSVLNNDRILIYKNRYSVKQNLRRVIEIQQFL